MTALRLQPARQEQSDASAFAKAVSCCARAALQDAGAILRHPGTYLRSHLTAMKTTRRSAADL